jgi:hypothetical protein
MFHPKDYFRISVIQVLIIFALLVGSVTAYAGGLGNELWGIDWTSDTAQVKQVLAKQGFIMTGQGKESDSKWLKFEQGRFLEIPCDAKVKWQRNDIKEVIVHLTEKGPKTADIYQQLIEYFQQNYGSPANTESYYLKSFPPIKVEAAVWQVYGEGKTAFEVNLTRMGTEEHSGEEPKDSNIEITIVKKHDQ